MKLSDKELLALLSNFRSDDLIGSHFLVRAATIADWSQRSITDPLNGYKRFIFEILRLINVDVLKKIKKRHGFFGYSDDIDIAKTIGMPIEDIKDFAGSAIDWKRGIIDFLSKIDKDLLSDLHAGITFILENRDKVFAQKQNTKVLFDVNVKKREVVIVQNIEIEKGKRGRKPKPKPEFEEPVVLKKRGRKPKPKPEFEEPVVLKKRGRKPKNREILG